MRTYERHQLKQDRFAETTKDTISWAVEHRSKLITGLIVAGSVLVVVIGGWYLWQSRSQKADAALASAMQAYDAEIRPANAPAIPNLLTFTSAQERARVAHDGFQKVADQYGHTKSGHIARYMAAVTLVDLGDLPGAEKELKAVADSGDQDLASLAKLALAGVYRSSNRNNDALALYKGLVDHPTRSVSKSFAELQLGEFYESTKQGGEAVKLYEEILKTDSGSAAAQLATQRMQGIKLQQ